MPDILKLTEDYASDDQLKWGRLASEVQFRRIQILLLREILVELKKLNDTKVKE